jgi:hypothetical protein
VAITSLAATPVLGFSSMHGGCMVDPKIPEQLSDPQKGPAYEKDWLGSVEVQRLFIIPIRISTILAHEKEYKST